MTSAIIAPSAQFNATHYGVVPLTPFHKWLAEIGDAIFCADPDQIGDVPIGGQISRFNESVAGRPVRAGPADKPILYANPSVDGGRQTFRADTLTECSLTVQDRNVPQAGTLLMYVEPLTQTINGSNNCFLFSCWDTFTRQQLSASFTVQKTLLFNNGQVGAGVSWAYGSQLVGGQPFVLAFVWDMNAGLYRIYFHDAATMVAGATGQPGADLTICRVTLFGANVGSNSLRCGAGITAMIGRALSGADLDAGMASLRSYYGMTN